MAADYLSAQEAADFLGVSRPTLYAYVSRGLVASEPGTGATRARRYPRRALEELKGKRGRRRDGATQGWGLAASALDSSITLVEGGRLLYRGRDACELSRTTTFERVAWLLWTGSPDGAPDFPPAAPTRDPTGPLVDRLFACLAEERARHPFTLAEPRPETLHAATAAIAALFAAAGAPGSGPLAERLARGWGVPSGDLGAALVLCADHGLATSTFAARCVASTDAPIPSALLAALCALEGRRHGGASRDTGDLLDDVERLGVEAACGRALARRGRLPGFGGSGVYPDGDPRALELLLRLELPAEDPAAQVLAYGERLGAAPSIELALAALARRAHLPDDAAFVLFALGRSAGWVAHALEAASTGTLVRPRARYTRVSPDAV